MKKKQLSEETRIASLDELDNFSIGKLSGKLYWRGGLVKTEQPLGLTLFQGTMLFLTGIGTAAQAICYILPYFGIKP